MHGKQAGGGPHAEEVWWELLDCGPTRSGAVAATPGAMEGESEAKESRKVQWEPSQRLQLLEVFAAEVLTLTQALTLTRP